MGTNTYANTNEICSKSSSGKTVAAMPDPCFTPPPTPAGVEVVVPYPNTASASDLDKGSAKVLICNKMAALEKDSCMKTSMGNEAAKPSSMQGGVVTKTTKGKVFFTKWSDDVKFEGKGVCRHVDPTTHNHGSTPGHCVPMPFMSGMTIPADCKELMDKIKENGKDGCSAEETTIGKNNTTKQALTIPNKQCEGLENLPSDLYVKAPGAEIDALKKKFSLTALDVGENMEKMSASMENTAKENKCLSLLRCVLQKYSATQNKEKKSPSNKLTCCPGQSGHHVIPKSMANAPKTGMPCWPSKHTAPTICVEGVNNTHGTHGKIHDKLKLEFKKNKEMNCKEVIDLFAGVLREAFSCDNDCIKAQLEDAKKTKCNKCEHNDGGKTVTTNSGKGGKSSTLKDN